MKHRLCLLLVLSTLIGCATRKEQTQTPAVAPIPAGSFAQQWVNPLRLGSDRVDELHLRDNTLFVYTNDKLVYAITRGGGDLTYLAEPQVSGGVLRPPLILGQYVVFPCGSTLDIFNERGRLQRTVRLEKPTRSGAVGQGNNIYIGLDHTGGYGVLAALDLTKSYRVTRWELMTFGAVTPTPAFIDGTLYAGSEDGRLYCVNEDREIGWGLENGIFETQGRFVSDIKADDFGVYASNTDSKLYCLDRITGKIKWLYYASTQLKTSPVVTPTMVYQFVPRTGIVAIDKLNGEPYRKPKWIIKDATQFLSEDQTYVYLRRRDNRIIAVDKASGDVAFASQSREYEVFAENLKDPTIFAATKEGRVVAIRPVLREGDVGKLVMDWREQPLATAQ